MKRREFLHAGLIALVASPANAQFGGLKPPKIPGVRVPDFNGEQFIKHTPPITTNLADVYEAVPGFDDYHPVDAASLTIVPRNAAGDYLALPGLYEITAQSFCLHAGSNPPSLNKDGYGYGYLYAPLKGPKSGEIERVLIRSESHPELPQYEVQLLLWSIIAEEKLSNCPDNIQKTARILLDENDRRALENDVLAVVPAQFRGKVYDNLPPLVREGLEAENNMRELLSSKVEQVSAPADQLVDSVNAPGEKVSAFYAHMESIAMRVGPLPEVPEKERVPWGQWSWHPDSFFIRILPNGYATTKRQLYYPESFVVAGNRITAPDDRVLTVSGTAVTLGKAQVNLGRSTPVGSDAGSLIALRNAVRQAEGANVDERPISDFLARAALSAIARGKGVLAMETMELSRGNCSSSATSVYSCGGGFGSGGGGGAGMGAPGTQRLAQSRTPKENPNIANARAATNALSNFGGPPSKGPSIPMTLAKSLLNWAFNATGAIDNAMNGTSTKNVPLPGHCFAGIAAPVNGVSALPRPKVKRGATDPPYLVDAQQALLDSLQALTEIGHARLAAEQTFSSAMTAENGQRVVFFRRGWGMAELLVADKSAALVDAYVKADGQDATVSADDWRAYCQRLRTTGFTAEERSDAHAVGLTEPEIDAILAQKRKLTDADRPAQGDIGGMREFSEAMRATGTDYARLPALSVRGGLTAKESGVLSVL